MSGTCHVLSMGTSVPATVASRLPDKLPDRVPCYPVTAARLSSQSAQLKLRD